MKQMLLLLVFLSVSCLSGVSRAENFKVGVIVPLSGAIAEYGVATKNGF